METQRRGRCAALTIVAVLSAAGLSETAYAAATNLNWTGGGNISNWYDAANWDGVNVPNNISWQATLNNAVDLAFTNTGNLTVNRITTTGAGHVTLAFAQVTFGAGTGWTPAGGLTVGTGGVTMNAYQGQNSDAFLLANGDLKATSTRFDENGTITQNAGTFDIALFRIPNGNNANRQYKAWSFVDGSNTLVTIIWCRTGTVSFAGTPVFADGRPDWDVVCHDSMTRWDLKGYGLYGDVVTLKGTFNNVNWVCLQNTNAGGTVDANSLIIGTSAQTNHFLNLHNTTVTLRGNGVAYNNFSTNKAVYSITNALFVFDPADGSSDVDTGSDDRDSFELDPTDWETNFAFGVIHIAEGDSIRLIGNENVGGGATNAMYAETIAGLGAGGTVVLNGHNLYLRRRAHNVGFDCTGGGRVVQPSGGTIITLR